MTKTEAAEVNTTNNYEIRQRSAVEPGRYTVMERVGGKLRPLAVFGDKSHAEGLLESLDAAGLQEDEAPLKVIQVQASVTNVPTVQSDMEYVAIQTEHAASVADWREITPESAVTIAAWWSPMSVGGSVLPSDHRMPTSVWGGYVPAHEHNGTGVVLAAFANGEEVEVAALLADIELTREAHPRMTVFDVNALDYLMTFVIHYEAARKAANI